MATKPPTRNSTVQAMWDDGGTKFVQHPRTGPGEACWVNRIKSRWIRFMWRWRLFLRKYIELLFLGFNQSTEHFGVCHLSHLVWLILNQACYSHESSCKYAGNAWKSPSWSAPKAGTPANFSDDSPLSSKLIEFGLTEISFGSLVSAEKTLFLELKNHPKYWTKIDTNFHEHVKKQ